MQDDEVRFSVFNAVRHPVESDACFMIEAIEVIVSGQSGLTDPLETSLVQNAKEELSEEAEEYVKWMDSFQSNMRRPKSQGSFLYLFFLTVSINSVRLQCP